VDERKRRLIRLRGAVEHDVALPVRVRGREGLVGTAVEHDMALPVTVSMRPYFSAYLLWTAQHQAVLAGEIEAKHSGQSRFSIEHRAYVLSSVVASAGFLETMVNELFQDSVDGYRNYVGVLGDACIQRMAQLWRETNAGRNLRPLEKYERLLELAGGPPLDRGANPYQDANMVLVLRNAIVHYHSVSLSAAAEAHALEKNLRQQGFDDNALMAGSANPWWPDHALGHGCATWSHRSVKALTDHVSNALGLQPHYQRHEQQGWFGQAPGEREVRS
jgi:hypothetical protein